MKRKRLQFGGGRFALLLAMIMVLGTWLPAAGADDDIFYFFDGFSTVYAGQDEEISVRVKLAEGMIPADIPINLRLTLTQGPGNEPAAGATLHPDHGDVLRTDSKGIAYVFSGPGITLGQAPEITAWPGKTMTFTVNLPAGHYRLQAQVVEMFGPDSYENLGRPGTVDFQVLPAQPHLRFDQFTGFQSLQAGTPAPVSFRAGLINPGYLAPDARLALRLTFNAAAGAPGGGSAPVPGVSVNRGKGAPVMTDASGTIYLDGYSLGDFADTDRLGRPVAFTLTIPSEDAYFLEVALVDLKAPAIALGNSAMYPFLATEEAPASRFSLFTGFNELYAGEPGYASFQARLLPTDIIDNTAQLGFRLTFMSAGNAPGSGSAPVAGVTVTPWREDPKTTGADGTIYLDGYDVGDFSVVPEGVGAPFTLTMPAEGAYFLEVALVDMANPAVDLGPGAMQAFRAMAPSPTSRFSRFTGFEEIAAGQPSHVSFAARLTPEDIIEAGTPLALKLTFQAAGNAPGLGSIPVPGIIVQGAGGKTQTTNTDGVVYLGDYAKSLEIAPDGIEIPFTLTVPDTGAYFLEVALVSPGNPDTEYGAPAMRPFQAEAPSPDVQTQISFGLGFGNIYVGRPVDLSFRVSAEFGSAPDPGRELAFRLTFKSAAGSEPAAGIRVISGWADESQVTNQRGEVILHGFYPADFAGAGPYGLIVPFTLVMPAEDAYFLEVALVAPDRPDTELGDSAMQPFMVHPDPVKVDFEIYDFDTIVANEKSWVTLWSRVMYTDAIRGDAPLLYRLQFLTADLKPAAATISYRRLGDLEKWQESRTDRNGYIVLPERPFSLNELWPIKTEGGVDISFQVALPPGQYILNAALADAAGYADVGAIKNPGSLGLYGEETFEFTVLPPQPEVNFTFSGFRNMQPDTATPVSFTAVAADNGALSPGRRLRHQLTLMTGDGRPVPGVAIQSGAGSSGQSYTTNAGGIAYFPPQGNLTLADYHALLGAGLTTNLQLQLPQGTYTATVQLVEAMDVGYLPVGRPRALEFKVGRNRAPEVLGVIDDLTVKNSDPVMIELDTVFGDADQEPLEFTAVSSIPTVVSVKIENNLLIVTPRRTGTAEITLTATDRWGLTKATKFRVIWPPSGGNGGQSGM